MYDDPLVFGYYSPGLLGKGWPIGLRHPVVGRAARGLNTKGSGQIPYLSYLRHTSWLLVERLDSPFDNVRLKPRSLIPGSRFEEEEPPTPPKETMTGKYSIYRSGDAF